MEDHQSETAQKIFAVARIISVYVFLFLLMVLNAARIPILQIGIVTPFFLLMGIYYWTLTRPSLLPTYLAFILGLMLDFITGQPVGANGLAFLVISFLLHSQRRFLKGQSWPVLWAGYGIACMFVGILHLTVFVLMNWSWPGLSTLIATVVLSVLAYPVTLTPMVAWQRLLSRPVAH